MIEMQGPGIYLNPPNKPVYQESQTILPQAVVGVGQGIDYGAIGQAAAQLGTAFVDLDMENKRKKKSRLLDELETKTRMGIDHASAYNDFDSVDAQIAEYKNQVKEIVGYDIDSDEGGQTTSSLLEQARKTSYGFELYGQKARRETADDVKISAYRDDQLSWQESLLQSDNQLFDIEGRIVQLEQMEKDVESLPAKTMGDRAYLASIRQDRIELMEQREKYTAAGAKNASEAMESNRKGDLNRIVNLEREITNGWEALGSFSKQLDDLAQKKDKTEADEKLAASLRIRANATAQQISDAEAILNDEKNNYAQEYHGQSWSSDFAARVLSPEQYNAVLTSAEKRSQTLNSLSFSPYNLASAAQENGIVDINKRVDTAITEGAAGISELDQRISEAQTPEEREYLLRARSAFLTRLEQRVLGVMQGGVDPITKNLVDTVSGFRFLDRKGLDYSVMPNALTAFAADSIESMTKPSSTISRVFRPSVDKFNQFLSTRLDIPASKFAGSSSTKEVRTQERLKESLLIIDSLTRRTSITASPTRINEAFIDYVQAAGINPYQSDNVSLRPWSELAPEIKNKKLQIPANGFTLTDFYVKALEGVLRSDNPIEEYNKTISTFFDTDANAFYGGVHAATDKPSMTSELADIILGGLKNPTTAQASAAVFMLMTPATKLQENLSLLHTANNTTDTTKKQEGIQTIKRLEVMATEYQGNGDPLQFIIANTPNLPFMQESHALREQLYKDDTTPLVGKYQINANTVAGEEATLKLKLSGIMKEIRENVFKDLTIPTFIEGLSFRDAILSEQNTNLLMRQVSDFAVDVYFDVLAAHGGKKPESFYDMVTDRVNARLADFKVNSPDQGLIRVTSDWVANETNLTPTFVAGSGIYLDVGTSGKLEKDIILDAPWDINGLDKVTWNQFGVVSTPPEVENPTAFALAIASNKGSHQLPPGNKAEHLMAIAEAVLGNDKSNRTMLIAQAAIRGLKSPTTQADAIDQVRRGMDVIRKGLESGEYKFFVSTDQSNLNEKQTSPVLTLRGREGSTLATMQPAPIRKSLLGTDVHRKTLKNITKEDFGNWAVRQINSGNVDHTKVVDWLTANGKSSITLSETTQWMSIVPISIPNEDYTYELVDHMGTKQWFVTKDGGERTPIRSSLSVEDLKTVDKVKHIYTGAEKGLSRRTGVYSVAGKPFIAYEWKPSMGNKWMLDASKYDMTTVSETEPARSVISPEEAEWENFIRTNLGGAIEANKISNMLTRALMNPADESSVGKVEVKPDYGLFVPGEPSQPAEDLVAVEALRPFGTRDGAPQYVTTIANRPVLVSKTSDKLGFGMPEIKERETTTGIIDIKDTYVYGGDVTTKLTYVRPSNSDMWVLLDGPVAGDVKIPDNLPPAEKLLAIAAELHRQLGPTGDRKKKLAASRLVERATATLGEAKRLKSEPEKLRAFEEYVKTEINQLLK